MRVREGCGGEVRARFAIALQFSSWPEPIQAPGIYPINFCSVDQREKGISRLQQRQAAGKNNTSWWLRTITTSLRSAARYRQRPATFSPFTGGD
jgi:hypothetical protein